MDASIVRPQSVFKEYVFETHPDSTETWRIENRQRVERITNQNVTNPFASYTGYLWPIPQEELDINDEIEQNPGYKINTLDMPSA